MTDQPASAQPTPPPEIPPEKSAPPAEKSASSPAEKKSPKRGEIKGMNKEELMRFYKGPPPPTPGTPLTICGRTLEVRERWKSTRKKGDGPNGGEPRRVFEFRPDWKMKGLKAIAPEDKVKSSKLMKEQEEMWRPIGEKSLFVLGIDSKLRMGILWTVEQAIFDHFILLVIVFNSLLIGSQRYRQPDHPINIFQNKTDIYLTILFTLECVLKVLAYGFVRDANAYLRNGWNVLDFVVVVTGILSNLELEGMFPTGWLRVFRVLRPLRSLNVIPEMKKIVNTVLLSIPRLGDVAAMALFLMTIFGILAIHLWSGVLFRQCRLYENPILLHENDVDQRCWDFPLHPEESGRLCGGRHTCEMGYCKNSFFDTQDAFSPEFIIDKATPGYSLGDRVRAPFSSLREPNEGEPIPWCPQPGQPEGMTNYEKTMWFASIEDFNFAITRFDHLPMALLVIFQCITMEGWVDVMYMTQDAFSDTTSAIIFVLLIVLGSLFLLNVALAVVWEAFSSLQDQGKDEDEEEENMPTTPDKAPSTAASPNPQRASRQTNSPPNPSGNRDSVMSITDGEEDQLWLDYQFVRTVRDISESDAFQNTIMFFIGINVLIMCLDKYPPFSNDVQFFGKVCNYIFTAVFFVEFVLMIIAIGPKKYLTTLMTFVDALIVISSIVELFMVGGGAITALRGFRLLRLFKLAKKWTSFRVLVKSMAKTVMSMGHFSCILALMIYVFTLMGMTFFATKLRFKELDDGHKVVYSAEELRNHFAYCPTSPEEAMDDSCIPRAHFDNFLWAFVTCFQILSGENWNTVMYDGMLATNWMAAIFFVLLVIGGQLIILSLFLAILMDNFEKCKSGVEAQEKSTEERMALQRQKTKITGADLSENPSMGSVVPAPEARKKAGDPDAQSGEAEQAAEAPPEAEASTPTEPVWPRDYSFFVFAPNNPIRVQCISFVSSPHFDNGILGLIVISTLAMLIDNPRWDPGSSLAVTLWYMNLVFTVIFFMEMACKQISSGLACGPKAYLRSGWNVLDGLVVLVAVIDFIPGLPDISFVKTLRTLRALRPLRIISRNANLKVVVNTVFKSVPELCNLVIVAGLFFLIFGLFAVNAFKGKFRICQALSDGELDYHDVLGFAAASRRCDPATMNCADADYLLTPHPLDYSWVCLDANNASASFGAIWSVNLAVLVDQDFAVGKPCTPSWEVQNVGAPPPGSPMLASEPSNNALLYGTGMVPPPSEDAALVLWHRPSYDAPICEVSCPVTEGPGGKPRPDGCGPILDTSGLPSVCDGSGLMDPPGMPALFIPGRGDKGITGEYAAWRSAGTRWTMPCADVEITEGPWAGATVEGCSSRMCEGELAPSTREIQSCERECVGVAGVDQFYCEKVCTGDKDSADCLACIDHCVAGCQCPDHCERNMADAAMCVEQGGLWWNGISQHFDNIGIAILTLFEISTTEGWVDVMYWATDATYPMQTPKRDHGQYFGSLFFVLFILVGSFFILNLCVGVIVDNFGRMKAEGDGEFLLTDWQKAWIQMRKGVDKEDILFGLTNLQDVPKTRRSVYFVVTDPMFEAVIMTCILLNTVIMAMKWFPEPESGHLPVVLDVCNYCFAGIFVMEAGLKIYALRAAYFSDGWNIFDFVCVISTVAGVLMQQVFDIQVGTIIIGIRLFRIARLFRLLRFMTGLNKIFTTFLRAIPKLFNVAVLLILLLVLFTTMGVHSFALLRFHGPVNEYANFRTPGRAVLALLRCFTGEGWNELMHSLGMSAREFGHLMQPCVDKMLITKDNYQELTDKCLINGDFWASLTSAQGEPIECGDSVQGNIFFILYTWLVTFVLLNLFVAVVLEGFEDGSDEAEEKAVLTQAIAVWKTFDPNLTLEIPVTKVPDFVAQVRCGVSGEVEDKGVEMKHTFFVLGLMNVKENKMVHFRDCVEASLRLIMTTGLSDGDMERLVHDIWKVAGDEDAEDRSWAEKLKSEPPQIVQEIAVRRMQAVFRDKGARKAGNSPGRPRDAPESEEGKAVIGSGAENAPVSLPGAVPLEGAGLELGSDANTLNRGDMPAAG